MARIDDAEVGKLGKLGKRQGEAILCRRNWTLIDRFTRRSSSGAGRLLPSKRD